MTETVLVVEDDEANAVLMEAILGRIGGFDVICSDDGDRGVELTRRIRALPAGANLPVLLLTAHAMRGDRERLLFSSGANDYVAKPIVNQNELVQLVRKHISSSGALGGSSTGKAGTHGTT
jgi:CheY-like chemotaxis protein